jgi:UDP-N-acetylmuramyl tripeptide synthase
MAAVDGVDGRYARRRYAGRAVRLLLAKNPAGWQEALTMVAPQPAALVVAVNAHVADGADPAWLWDVPFEQLRGRRVIATGERCTDVAVRLRYADVEHLQVRECRDALRVVPAENPVEAVANYTAFQALRKVIGDG